MSLSFPELSSVYARVLKKGGPPRSQWTGTGSMWGCVSRSIVDDDDDNDF